MGTLFSKWNVIVNFNMQNWAVMFEVVKDEAWGVRNQESCKQG